MIQNIEPREYQEEILKTAINHNTLVVLPTGMGKTLIALMLAVERQKRHHGKILFLAPTRPLAMQHLEYFKKHLPELYADMQLFTGKVVSKKRMELWQKADMVFSTPQCIANDLKKGLSLEDVSLLIEDEAHRCLKSYDYVYVASEYIKQAGNPRILGLTASPGSDAKVIKEICKNLGINAVEARTRESIDVKPYLQELKTEIIRVDLPEEFARIRNNLQEIFKKRVEELKNRKLLFAPATKKNLLEMQGRIMRSIALGNRHFNTLRGASIGAQVIKLQYALELIETQGVASFHRYMQDLFEQAEKRKSKAALQLVKQREFNQAYVAVTELLAKRIEHPKLKVLQQTVEKEMQEKTGKKRIIVFSHYRDMVARICLELNKINNVNAKVFVGQARRDEGGLTQKEQQEVIDEFKEGKINVLVASSIGEEGLDLPEVNTVIFYEPIPSAIRKIQRTGRTARLMPGKLVILITRDTRDEAYHYAAMAKERKMHGILDGMTEKLKKGREKQKGIGEFA